VNAGFDTSSSGWSAIGSYGEMSWLAGSFSDGEATGDAQACRYSGSIRLQCPVHDPGFCYYEGPCVTIEQWRDYNFGVREAWKGGGPHYCGYHLFTSGTCDGTPSEQMVDLPPDSKWTDFQYGTFNSAANTSARAFCVLDASAVPAGLYVDMFYLSPAPGGY
jgi:hypothetical protein